MSTSSFSLPSASGVVSLLNDAKDSKQSNGIHHHSSIEDIRPELSERNSSSSSSIQSLPSFGGTGSSSDAGKDSLASTFTTFTDSSTDGSESSRVGEIKALRRQLQDHSFADAKRRSIKREGGTDGILSSFEMSQSGDYPSSKKQRSKESPLDQEVNRESHTEAHQPGQMLNQERLAASPKPMNDNHGITREEAKKDVPMNMHKAMSMSENDEMNRSMGMENTSQTSTPVGKRRYPCSHPGCNKTFSTSGHAARHNRIHTGSKPYRCTFPGCNASFSRQDNSLQHYRTHVLHPKSRSNGANSSFHDSTSSLDSTTNGNHSSLTGLDPETEATVRMGRKALEEGTAIAVVHEIVDGSGRKGEAVQRMVGQPRGSRRGSTSSNGRSINGRREQQRQSRIMQGYPLEEGVDDDEDDLSAGTSFGHSNGLHLPLPSSTYPHSYQHSSPAPPHQYHPSQQYQEQFYANQFSDNSGLEDPWSQKAMSYPPPPPPPPAYSSSRYTSGPNLFAHSTTTAAPTQSHRPYISGHGSSLWNQLQERPMSASASSDPNRNETLSYDHAHPNYLASTVRGPAAAYGSYPSTDQSLERSSFPSEASFANDHRRSHSLGVHGRAPMRMPHQSRDGDQGLYPAQGESARGNHSVSLSPPGGKKTSPLSRSNDEALSLLSVNATARPPSSSNTTNALPPFAKTSNHSPINKGMKSRFNTHDMQLPLPPISKLPCSSDRSTSVLTPTTPLDDVKMNRGSADLPLSNIKASHSDLNLLPPLVDGGDGGGTRILPPLRTSPHSL